MQTWVRLIRWRTTVHSSITMVSLLMAIGPAHSETFTVLGMPLGSKLKPAPVICPENTDRAKYVCWIGRPFTHRPTGSRLGPIHLPDLSTRPAWAAYVMFRGQVSKDGVLDELTLQTFGVKDKHDIAESITGRFGLPARSTLHSSGVSGAAWSTPQVYIEMTCGEIEFCLVAFRTPQAQEQRMQEAAARKKELSTRPVSP